MLKLYASTVLFYALVIVASIRLCAQSIKDNGWIDDSKSTPRDGWTTLFCVSVIPVVRLAMVAVIFYMASNKKPTNWPTK